MHLYPIVELEYYQSVVHGFATSDFRIHNVVETGVWPLTLAPTRHQFTGTIEEYGRVNGETDGAERERGLERNGDQYK